MAPRAAALFTAALPPWAAALQQTEYPLYMIGSSSKHHCIDPHCKLHPDMTEADADALSAFRYIEGTFDTDEIALVRARGTGTAFTSYVESATTYNDMRTHTGFEFGFRSDARFYLHGNLTASLGSSDTHMRVCQYVKQWGPHSGFPPPLVASTPGTGEYSNGSYGIVTYVRVGDELMKLVDAANSSSVAGGTGCQMLTVQRGIDGTTPASHAAGDVVLAPGLLGDPFGGKGPPGYHPRYNSTYGVDWLVNWTLSALDNGYQGPWFDSFHPQTMFRGFMTANEWDTETGDFLTQERALAAQRARVERIFAALHTQLGRYPLVLANDGGQWDPTLLASAAGFRPLDGLCLEGWGGAEGDAVNGGCWNRDPVPSHWRPVWHDEKGWAGKVRTLMDAAQSGRRALPAIGQAGCVASSVEAFLPALRDQFELYTYASFLMGVESRDPARGPLLGIAGYYVGGNGTEANATRTARIHERFFWPIGDPARTVRPANLTEYRVAGHTTYLRPFSNGVALVNPVNASDPAVPLGATYMDPATGRAATTADLGAHSGMILLAKL